MQEVDTDVRSYDCFYATVEEGEDGGTDTRAHFEQSAVKWDSGDAIMVYSNSQTTPQTFTRSGSGAFAGEGISGSTFYAFYPSDGVRYSSSSHNVSFNSPAPAFDAGQVRMPMVASGSGNSLSFKQTCGVLHFVLTSSKSYDTITLRGNNGEDIAGIGTVNVSSSKPTFSIDSNPSKEIVATVPSGVNWKEGVNVYFVLPPVHFYNGFTLTVSKGGETKSKSTTKDVSNSRQKMTRYVLNLDDVQASGGEASPEAVDLGLSVKWATFNVGASKPEEYGDYFAWGETETKSTYNWSTYKWCNGSNVTLTKYDTTVDNKTVLDLEDDVAHVKWGGKWRMPTQSEMEELKTECSWVWTAQNGINGYRITSKKAGYTDKSIFLPAAGDCHDNSVNYVGSFGDYWSSTLCSEGTTVAWHFDFDNPSVAVAGYGKYGDRAYGFSVRPVYADNDDYEFFLGTWSVPRANDYDTWVITQMVFGSSYYISGIDGYDDLAEASYTPSSQGFLLWSHPEFKNATVTHDNNEYEASVSLLGYVYRPDLQKEVYVNGVYGILSATRKGEDSMILTPNSISLQGLDGKYTMTGFAYIFKYVVNNENWSQAHTYITTLPCEATRQSKSYAPKAVSDNNLSLKKVYKGLSVGYGVKE